MIKEDNDGAHLYQGVRFRQGELGGMVITKDKGTVGLALVALVPYEATLGTVVSEGKTEVEFLDAVEDEIDRLVVSGDFDYVMSTVAAHAKSAYSTLWTP